MRSFLVLIVSCCLLFGYTVAFAINEMITPPVVTTNVHVVKNATPSQCPSSIDGSAGSESMTDVSGYGMDTGMDVVGVRSCTNCAIDPSSNDCVCARCYGYYN